MKIKVSENVYSNPPDRNNVKKFLENSNCNEKIEKFFIVYYRNALKCVFYFINLSISRSLELLYTGKTYDHINVRSHEDICIAAAKTRSAEQISLETRSTIQHSSEIVRLILKRFFLSF